MFARPATGDAIFLIAAASGLIALSSASGPSRTAPVIWPRSAILHRAAASIVEGTFAVTVSIALRIATRTSSTPIACARSIAFWMMSTFASRSGAMLTAASVTISGSGWPGTSMMKQWLIRRSVRMPLSFETTAAISSSVWRLPFMSASARPARTCSTALAADAWLCSASTISTPARSKPTSLGNAADALDGTDQDRIDQPQAHRFGAPRMDDSSHGCATATLIGACAWAAAISRSYRS